MRAIAFAPFMVRRLGLALALVCAITDGALATGFFIHQQSVRGPGKP